MARIFVSYSRRNKDFCKQLTDELQKRDFDFWVDWEGIPPTVDWMKEIEKGIEEADTFLAIVTPDWISSKVCMDELNIAVKNGKRLIPVVPYDIVWNSVPPALAQLNFILFTEAFDFNEQLNKLFTALDTDYNWLKTHRRLQVKALEWERANKENGFLLRGRDLEDAEQQVSVNANKDPHTTDLQREYVLKSRQGSTRQRRITTGILIGLVAGMLGIIALLAKPYVEEMIALARARELTPLVSIPAGSINFQVDDEFQTIEIPTFDIEMKPVSNKVYSLCVQVNKCTAPIGYADYNDPAKAEDPVGWITIVQAATYCDWVGRELPSAPQWERSAQLFAESNLYGARFIFGEQYEWTSSYLENNAQFISGEWNEELSQLNLDWIFLQEKGSLDSTNAVKLETSYAGSLGTHATLGFRCAGV